uniref:Uncharacterized protein n=1 Tax=Echinococcus granulosus TaxID=6210 RepID=A0A068X297_ECHGR|nr:hypothetical protein EgrG_001156000 [Echinococcus granulosus]
MCNVHVAPCSMKVARDPKVTVHSQLIWFFCLLLVLTLWRKKNSVVFALTFTY